jgi:hypothetical protein
MLPDKIRNHWRAEFSAAVGVPSAPVLLPRRFGTATAKVMPGAGGTAELEYTLDDPNAVLDDPDAAAWETWDPGAVGVDTTRALIAVVGALRLVAYSQPAEAQVIVSFDF